jgi:hypothetical protein
MGDTRKEIFERIYKRCFKFGSCNYKETGCSDCPILVTLVKAETLLDKQEQGLLIELPVAIGTEAWRIVEHSGGGRIPNWYEKYKVKFALYMLSDWGKTVFATEAEAEEALAKMGGK